MGVLILGLKYYAYLVSGSTALKSDAIESVVNVVAAVFALGAVIFADKPADKDHPYGHGKIEHFSAAFEGGLISLAAVLIAWEAIDAMWHGAELKDLGLGLVINFIAGLPERTPGPLPGQDGPPAALPRHRGRRPPRALGLLHHPGHRRWACSSSSSRASAGWIPSWPWAWPLLLARTGFKLVRSSSQALLDMEDPDLLEKLLEVINRTRPADIITIHELRTLRSGRYTHVDIHMVVPEFYEMGHAHDLAEDFGKQVILEAGPGRGAPHPHRPLPARLVQPVRRGRLPDPAGTPDATGLHHARCSHGSRTRLNTATASPAARTAPACPRR